MRIKNTSHLITATISVFSTILLISYFFTANYVEEQIRQTNQFHQTINALNAMERNSFRQIASLRAYFATNNKMFLEQYREVHPDFVEQISEPIEKLDIPDASLAVFHGVRNKMEELAKLNGQALRNIEEKTPKAAEDSINSDSYFEKRGEMSSVVREAFEALEKEKNRMIATYSEKVTIARIFFLLSCFINITLVIGALLFFYQRKVVGALVDLTQKVNRVLRGDNEVQFGYENDQTELGELARSMDDYRAKSAEVEISRHLSESMNNLSDLLQDADTTKDFANVLSEFLAKHLHAPAIAFFLNEQNKFSFAGGFCADQAAQQFKFALSEGFLGQAAHNREIFYIETVTDANLKISSAFGEVRLNQIAAAPLFLEEEVFAVLEIAYIGALKQTQKDFIRTATRVATPRLSIILRNERTEQLLAQTQLQAAELAASEQQIKARSEELEHLNDALSSAKQNAESATQMKSDFLANMNHEIRTPMNAIIGMSRLVSKTEVTKKQKDYLDKIQISSQHLLRLINDVLDFSKIEAGKLTIEQTDFTLAKVLENVNTMIQEKAHDKGLELIFDIDPAAPEFLIGDPLRMGQILVNYASNAIKFTEKGQIAVVVRIEKEMEQGYLLRLSVSDTGIGLSPEQKDKLFQSFQQSDTSITRKYGGTGLGLAISKKLTELMGGKVGVESELGKGSTFWFTVLVGKSQKRKHAIILRDSFKGKRALVVDDNEMARSVLAEMLRGMGVTVDVAAGGKAALVAIEEKSANEPYDLVSFDWQMPDMDGLEASRQLHKLSLQKMPKVLLVTAFGREEALSNAENSGIDDVLIKPVSASILFEGVTRIFGGASLQNADASNLSAVTPASDLEMQIAAIGDAQILLVEDNEINQEIAIEILKDVGFKNIDLAENGLLALQMAQAKEYDAVLMDIQMPVMDGLTATREIRKIDRLKNLPILAMTANAMESDRKKSFDAGMNEHIPKPIEPEELWAAMLRQIRPKMPVNLETSKPIKAAEAENTEKKTVKIEGVIEAIEVKEEKEEFPTLSGFSATEGLSRSMGKKSLYWSILGKFVRGQKNIIADIKSALDAKDINTAERLAHTLKGVAANIGANAISEKALLLEKAINAEEARDKIEALLQNLAPDLSAFISALEQKIPAPKTEIAASKVSAEVLTRQLKKLRQLLKEDDSEAANLLEEEAALFQQAFGDQFANIENRIKQFDFEQALKEINAATKKKS